MNAENVEPKKIG